MADYQGYHGGQVYLAEYLFTRLYQVGVRSVHGVPGDYNLTSLDFIEPAGLHWVGNANELNAGYAADGYGRINGISALVTAFGVGELSALNAIGGAFSERVPVIHVVGTPATHAQKSQSILHHSLGDGNFRVFAQIYKDFTCAQANLTNPKTAPEEIDRVILQCLKQSRPVYIELPTDLVKAKVYSHRLNQSLKVLSVENCPSIEEDLIKKLCQQIRNTKRPLFIVDGFTRQADMLEEMNKFIYVTGYPTYVTPFGKGRVNESFPNFCGTYMGSVGKDVHVEWVNSCDLVIRFGPLDADTNTYGFTTLTNRKVTIDINETSIDMQGVLYDNLNTKILLQKLFAMVYHLGRSSLQDPHPNLGNPRRDRILSLLPPMEDGIIEQKTFWTRISDFLKPNDVILTETGTPSSGGQDLILPPATTLINSAIWLSIGYTLAASVGVALAQRDLAAEKKRPEGRTIVFQGDGSFQMTAQSISDVFRNRLNLTIFLINNDGYTIERYIHGMTAGYNDVHPWNYLDAPHFFGAPKDYPVFTRRVVNWGELRDVMKEGQLIEGKGFNMVEVVMGQQDAPESLKDLVRLVCERDREWEED
jgi:pyruvate decarboxylase